MNLLQKFNVIGAIVNAFCLIAVGYLIGAMLFSPFDMESIIPKRLTNIYQHVQDVTGTVEPEKGSGIFKQTRDGQVWFITCGHVTAHLQDETNSNKFKSCQITQLVMRDGEVLGELKFTADMVRYSAWRAGEDIAILRVKPNVAPTSNVQFYLGGDPPAVGTRLVHCGMFASKAYRQSVSEGILSHHCRTMRDGKILEQGTFTVFGGSSGGGVWNRNNGQYVGMLVRGIGETNSLYIPIRQMYRWAYSVDVGFIFNDNLAIPSDEELSKLPIDVTPG